MVPLEQAYFRQYSEEIFMSGLELLGFVFVPKIDHLKTFLENDCPKKETVNPLEDIIAKSQC